jgi:hypothetical protein
MKNNKILVIILLVLVAAAVYLFVTNKTETVSEIEGAKSDFAIEDTSSIDKIFIADSKGKTVTLSKTKGVWMVDNKYVARPDNVRLLMKTFNRIEVKSPVPNAALENTIKNIATGGTKVEIYQGENKPAKIYYVGGPTLNHQGTYMVLETEGIKSSVPFIMHIPGFYGYLTTRFFTESEQWRDAVVFKYATDDIQSIKIKYFETPKQSFIIENNNEGFEVKDYESNNIVKDVDAAILQQYVSMYEGIYYEMIDVESTQEKKDSIIASQPIFNIEVNGAIGGKNKIVAYHMPNYRQTIDSKSGEPYLYDVDRMYALLNDELFVYIQFATFDQITLPQAYFKKR